MIVPFGTAGMPQTVRDSVNLNKLAVSALLETSHWFNTTFLMKKVGLLY